MAEREGPASEDALTSVLGALRCPVCGQGLALDDRTLRCVTGHGYDLAKQGYVSLLAGPLKFTGDSTEMVAARQEFLDASHFEGFLSGVAEVASRYLPAHEAPIIVELGAGTGHYLARVLGSSPRAWGIAVDASKPAARRAARAHPRAAALRSDAWAALPIADRTLSMVMSIFAPRNAAESARILRPGGVVIVLTPTPRHLAELVAVLSLVQVDERKPERLEAAMAEYFDAVETIRLETPMALSHEDIEKVVAMGPSARHGDQVERSEAIAGLSDPLAVTASALVTVFRLR